MIPNCSNTQWIHHNMKKITRSYHRPIEPKQRHEGYPDPTPAHWLCYHVLPAGTYFILLLATIFYCCLLHKTTSYFLPCTSVYYIRNPVQPNPLYEQLPQHMKQASHQPLRDQRLQNWKLSSQLNYRGYPYHRKPHPQPHKRGVSLRLGQSHN